MPTSDYFNELALKNKSAYQTNDPFPHIVIDNVFDTAILENILTDFPDINDKAWNYKRTEENEIKMASNIENSWPKSIQNFMRYLNSQEFLSFLEKITGIENLIPDPDYVGGGLHQITKGGVLKIHADFNKHPKTALDRRINVLIYLNKNWNPEWNGQLELWDTSMQNCVQRVNPDFNRMVVFSTTSNSYHGHPNYLKSPDGTYRRSIALYYYTNGRPAEEINENHSTLFKERPKEEQTLVSYFLKAKKIATLFIPPVFLAIKHKLSKHKN